MKIEYFIISRCLCANNAAVAVVEEVIFEEILFYSSLLNRTFSRDFAIFASFQFPPLAIYTTIDKFILLFLCNAQYTRQRRRKNQYCYCKIQ
jgi:hypothetical protein